MEGNNTYILLAIFSCVIVIVLTYMCCWCWRRRRSERRLYAWEYLVDDGRAGSSRSYDRPVSPSTVRTTSNETVRTRYDLRYESPQYGGPVNHQGIGAAAVTPASDSTWGYHHFNADHEIGPSRVRAQSSSSSNYSQDWQPQATPSRQFLTVRPPVRYTRHTPSPPKKFSSNFRPKLVVSTRNTTRNVPKFTHFRLHYLIIATDATPDNVGGYCLDFAAQTCEYYSFPTCRLPKCLKVRRHFDSAEFEMNNLAFALLYWEPLILERRILQVYTDNNSIRKNGIKPEHGEKVRAHLDHLEKCGGVTVRNKWKHHINKKHRPADFEKYIVPADNLSRGNIEAFKDGIQKSFPYVWEFSELDTIPLAADMVQRRWETYCQQPCNCDMSSFTKNSHNDERATRPVVKANPRRWNKKVPKVKRLNRK